MVSSVYSACSPGLVYLGPSRFFRSANTINEFNNLIKIKEYSLERRSTMIIGIWPWDFPGLICKIISSNQKECLIDLQSRIIVIRTRR